MKKSGSRKKTLRISLLLLAMVLGGVYAYNIWQLSHLNSNPQFQEISGNLISRFKAGQTTSINPVSGNIVYFDLGSRHSFINRRSVERLDSMGFTPKYSPTCVYTTDADGHYHLFTRKVTTDITLPNPELPDSMFIIRNAELLLVDNDHPNVFGMDFLRNIVIERLWPEGIISFYKEVPEGYSPVCDITVHDSPLGNYIGSAGRASIRLAVNDEAPRDYFLDTGGNMRDIEVVQPKANMLSATSAVEIDSITGYYIQRRCRVSFGNRMRFSNVVYCDTLHTDEFSVNPLQLFDQDFVIDMRGRRLMIHKTRQL